MMFNKKSLLVALLLLVFFVSACDSGVVPPGATSGDVKTFGSEREFLDFMDNIGSQQFTGQTRTLAGSFDVVDMAVESFDGVGAEAMPASAPKTDLDYSETNVQVKGVDELDLIKTDGSFIYTSTARNVFIVKSYPAEEAEIISKISLENDVEGLFIYEDVLAVTGVMRNIKDLGDHGFSARNPPTFFYLYDVSDRENPSLLKEYVFDGSYFNARLYDGVVYLSTSYNPWHRVSPMPIVMVDGVSEPMPVSRIHYFDVDYSNPSFVSVHSIDLESKENIDSKTLILEGSNHLYMSYDNIYLTFNERVNTYELKQELTIDKMLPRLSSSDRDLVNRIKEVDDDILSKYEKQNKILQVVYEYVRSLSHEEQIGLEEEIKKEVTQHLVDLKYLEYTVIHKLSVDSGRLDFVSSNKVPGFVYGQFALDEYQGTLRVATTLSAGRLVNEEYDAFDWQKRSPSMNNVYTLDEDMNLVGRLEGLAPTESVFSARYSGDRLYLVTFRQVDPFFVIDLSNPENPKDLGELKITGYSRYLHVYDEDTVIGIGREGTDTGRLLGFKISLFDVSDVTNPEEIVTYVSPQAGSSTGAEWEHRAFLFSKERELLVIPTQNYDFREPENNYAGALVFKINREEITPRGLITHMEGAPHRDSVQRSLFIEDYLFTKSPNLLRINHLDTLEGIKNISLSAPPRTDIPVY